MRSPDATVSKKISLDKIKAIRSIRAGTSIEDVCVRLGLQQESIRLMEASYRSVPDEILHHIEIVLCEREKLRRLVAALVPTLPT